MACCILGAIVMSQLIAVWNMRHKLMLFALSILVTAGALVFEIKRHADHIQQYVWDAKAILQGEDPAVAALSQPALKCVAKASQLSSNTATTSIVGFSKI